MNAATAVAAPAVQHAPSTESSMGSSRAVARVSAASLADHRCIGPHCPVCEAMGAFRRIEDRVAADVRRSCIAARREAERVHAWISRIASSAACLTPVSQGTRLIV